MPDLFTLRDLHRRLTEATGEDDDLDLAIAFAIVPDVVCLRYNSVTDKNEAFTHWRYTASIDASRALIRREFPNAIISSKDSVDFAAVKITTRRDDSDRRCVEREAPTEPLAACLALISALIAIKERADG